LQGLALHDLEMCAAEERGRARRLQQQHHAQAASHAALNQELDALLSP
jgi:hypothetical protein